MRTVQELIDENVCREEMTTEEHIAFVNYWFEQYEKGGFCESFATPFDLHDWDRPYIGKSFQVTGRVEFYEADLETLPMWHIEFEDGHRMDAYPEEITKIERDEDE